MENIQREIADAMVETSLKQSLRIPWLRIGDEHRALESVTTRETFKPFKLGALPFPPSDEVIFL